MDERILKLVRIQASLAASCAFCMDMNSFQADQVGITPEELLALQSKDEVNTTASFSRRERIAIEYARLISNTPLNFPSDFALELKECFSEREIVFVARCGRRLITGRASFKHWAFHPQDFPPNVRFELALSI